MLSDTAPLRFFVLTCRDPRTDFRAPLVEALREHFETFYIWLKRRPIIQGPDGTRETSIGGLLRFMRRPCQDRAVPVYFNSTNTYFPTMTAVLRQICPPGIWCMDMHDDLRYHNKGLKRLTENLIIRFLCQRSHLVVHAAPTLQELFPRSVHLGNASDIKPLSLANAPDNAVLVLASIDERLDFGFLLSLASLRPDLTFHLHGWTRPDDLRTKRALEDACRRQPNIIYHGAYTSQDLPGILSRYRVTVAPYRAGSPLTRYIDPLRFYHCLNAGLEVISTPIPQARHMHHCMHVVEDPASCADVLTGVLAGRLAKQPDYTPITWQQRAERLIEIVLSLPRTQRLLQRSVTYASDPWH